MNYRKKNKEKNESDVYQKYFASNEINNYILFFNFYY